MSPTLFEINDFKGGMTLNEKLGRADQFASGNHLDFLTKKGKLAPGFDWVPLTIASSAPTM